MKHWYIRFNVSLYFNLFLRVTCQTRLKCQTQVQLKGTNFEGDITEGDEFFTHKRCYEAKLEESESYLADIVFFIFFICRACANSGYQAFFSDFSNGPGYEAIVDKELLNYQVLLLPSVQDFFP